MTTSSWPVEGDRWFPVLSLGLLALATGVSLFTQSLFDAGTGWVLGGAAVAALWVGAWSLVPARGPGTRRSMVEYAGRTCLAFGLTLVNPFFCLFAFVGYLDAFDVFRGRAAYLALGATAVVMAGSQSGGLPPGDAMQAGVFLVLIAVNIGLAGYFSHVSNQVAQLSDSRAETIDELSETNARLEAALVENRALQERLLVQARETGVEEERTRLAREIHDTIAQGLAGIVTQIQAARDDSTPLSARVHLDRAMGLARQSLVEARRSVQGLGPAPLEEASLPEALRDLVTEWSAQREARSDFVVTGAAVPLHPEIEATLLRVAQESLTNAAKHAHAGRVGITLTYMDDDVSLDVRDDGIGFDPATRPNETAFGLRGMRQRAERVAGVLDVESEPGGGTAVSVRLPAISRSVA